MLAGGTTPAPIATPHSKKNDTGLLLPQPAEDGLQRFGAKASLTRLLFNYGCNFIHRFGLLLSATKIITGRLGPFLELVKAIVD
jgi:hypothetical protein